MITSMHLLIFTRTTRQRHAAILLRDVLGLPFVEDAGSEPGWLIFGTGRSEVGVHPTHSVWDQAREYLATAGRSRSSPSCSRHTDRGDDARAPGGGGDVQRRCRATREPASSRCSTCQVPIRSSSTSPGMSSPTPSVVSSTDQPWLHRPLLPSVRSLRSSSSNANGFERHVPASAARLRASGPGECGDPVEPGQLVRVADGVDAGDATVLDGEAHRGVDLTADVDPDGG